MKLTQTLSEEYNRRLLWEVETNILPWWYIWNQNTLLLITLDSFHTVEYSSCLLMPACIWKEIWNPETPTGRNKNIHFVQYCIHNSTALCRGCDVCSTSVSSVWEQKLPHSLEPVRHYASDQLRTPSSPYILLWEDICLSLILLDRCKLVHLTVAYSY